MKASKLAPKPPMFFVCDGLRECGRDDNTNCGAISINGYCKHTKDVNHALYSEHKHFRKHKDGSLWEELRDISHDRKNFYTSDTEGNDEELV